MSTNGTEQQNDHILLEKKQKKYLKETKQGYTSSVNGPII